MTDVYLAGLAHSRGGKLVTFDRAVLWSAVAGAKPSLVEVLSADSDVGRRSRYAPLRRAVSHSDSAT